MNYYPKDYDEFVEKSRCSEIDKVNIEQFMSIPNERDYNKLAESIAANDKKIETSIDLDELIDGK